MKRCTLDGDALADVSKAYRQLAAALDAPGYFGDNPDALWDALTEYAGETVEVTLRKPTRSSAHFRADFDRIAAVLRKAAAEGLLVLRFE